MAEPNKSRDAFVPILILNHLEVGMERHKGSKGPVSTFSASMLQFWLCSCFSFFLFTSGCYEPAICSQKRLGNTILNCYRLNLPCGADSSMAEDFDGQCHLNNHFFFLFTRGSWKRPDECLTCDQFDIITGWFWTFMCEQECCDCNKNVLLFSCLPQVMKDPIFQKMFRLSTHFIKFCRISCV